MSHGIAVNENISEYIDPFNMYLSEVYDKIKIN